MVKKKQTFETSLAKLEEIVTQLEEGELSLEDSLKLFEDGVKLSRECQERLDQAERRIEVLLEDKSGNRTLQALDQDNLNEKKPEVKKRIVFDDDHDDDDLTF